MQQRGMAGLGNAKPKEKPDMIAKGSGMNF